MRHANAIKKWKKNHNKNIQWRFHGCECGHELNANAENESVYEPIGTNANAIELIKDFDVPMDVRHPSFAFAYGKPRKRNLSFKLLSGMA